MRLFVYEHLSASTLPGADSLRAEGWAMLAAVLTDLADCPGVAFDTLLALSLADPARECAPGLTVHLARSGAAEADFRSRAQTCSHALVIAPEFDDLLEQRCRWAEEAGTTLIGPSSTAVALTADKLHLAEHLLRHGVATPPTELFTTRSVAEDFTPKICLPPERMLPGPFPLIVKPRDGAGSQATFLVRDADELRDCPARAHAEGWAGESIVQPCLVGRPISLAILVGPAGFAVPLAAGEQHLSDDGRFRYRGGRLPLPADLQRRAESLARRAVAAVPGLAGYVGLDLILGETAVQDAVIEINPRLTTTYVGLRALARFNLAGAILAVCTGAPLADLSWHDAEITFAADGAVLGR